MNNKNNNVTTSVYIDSFNFSIKDITMKEVKTFIDEYSKSKIIDNINLNFICCIKEVVYLNVKYDDKNDFKKSVIKYIYNTKKDFQEDKILHKSEHKNYKNNTYEIFIFNNKELKPYKIIIEFKSNGYTHFTFKGIHSYKTSYMMIYQFIRDVITYFKNKRINITRCDVAFDFKSKNSSSYLLDFKKFNVERQRKYKANVNELEDEGTIYIEEKYGLEYKFKNPDSFHRYNYLPEYINAYKMLKLKYKKISIDYSNDTYFISLTLRSNNSVVNYSFHQDDILQISDINYTFTEDDIYKKKNYRQYYSYYYNKQKKSKYIYSIIRFEITLDKKWFDRKSKGYEEFLTYFINNFIKLFHSNKYEFSYDNQDIYIDETMIEKYLIWFLKFIDGQDVETSNYLLNNERNLMDTLIKMSKVSNLYQNVKNSKDKLNKSKLAKEAEVTRAFIDKIIALEKL